MKVETIINSAEKCTKFVTISDELFEILKDADRIVLSKESEETYGLIFYADDSDD